MLSGPIREFIKHIYVFQISAQILFYNNLGLCGGLTRLCRILRLDNFTGLNETEVMRLGPPSAKKLMTYRSDLHFLPF